MDVAAASGGTVAKVKDRLAVANNEANQVR
jgi:hypothetical protein